MMIDNVKIKDGSLDFFTFGNGKRVLVIIPGISLHSVMLSADAVRGQYKIFEDTHKVIVFDRNTNLKENATIEDMANDTVEALDALEITDFDLFGTSQGGMIAQYIAVKIPNRVKKLALASTMSRQNEFATEKLSKWVDLCDKGGAELNLRVFSDVYSKGYREKYKAAFESLVDSGTEEEIKRFKIMTKACFSCDIYDRLGQIKCKTIVFGAEKDGVLGAPASRETAKKIGCEIYMYEEYGHAAYDESPDFIGKLHSFFKDY